MKSAIELAMERARVALGDENIELTAEQKEAIGEVRKKYEAKWAEQEIGYTGRLRELGRAPDPQQAAQARAEIQREMARKREELDAERDARIQAIRQGRSA